MSSPVGSAKRRLLCPSASAGEEAVVFGVRTGDGAEPGIRYLDHPVPASSEVLALAQPVDPREVFRMASPCAESACAHFSQSRCALATRIAQHLPEAVDELPACGIRRSCRWFSQEGKSACLRCPAVITMQIPATPQIAAAALDVDTTRATADDKKS